MVGADGSVSTSGVGMSEPGRVVAGPCGWVPGCGARSGAKISTGLSAGVAGRVGVVGPGAVSPGAGCVVGSGLVGVVGRGGRVAGGIGLGADTGLVVTEAMTLSTGVLRGVSDPRPDGEVSRGGAGDSGEDAVSAPVSSACWAITGPARKGIMPAASDTASACNFQALEGMDSMNAP